MTTNEGEFPEVEWPGPERRPFVIGRDRIGDPQAYLLDGAYADLLNSLKAAQRAGMPVHVILHSLELDLSEKERRAVQVAVYRQEGHSLSECAEHFSISLATVKRDLREFQTSEKLRPLREALEK